MLLARFRTPEDASKVGMHFVLSQLKMQFFLMCLTGEDAGLCCALILKLCVLNIIKKWIETVLKIYQLLDHLFYETAGLLATTRFLEGDGVRSHQFGVSVAV